MNIPGAPYYTTDPTGQQTKMRGVTNSKVLVLVDGAPVHDPFYTTTQWFKIPLSSIERVEVVRGGASSIWGNLAVAGVVNIITKKPIDNSGTLDVNHQSMNTTNAALSKNFVAGSSLGIRVSGDLLRHRRLSDDARSVSLDRAGQGRVVGEERQRADRGVLHAGERLQRVRSAAATTSRTRTSAAISSERTCRRAPTARPGSRTTSPIA